MLTVSRIGSVEYYIECVQNERDRTQYYTDAADEPPGNWYSPTGWLVADGSTVSPADLRKVAAGFNPNGGPRFVQSNVKNRKAAYDLTFSAPKAVSTIWAVGTAEQRQRIEAAHAVAVKAALDKIRELQLIETRRGKAGAIKEVPEDLLAAIFDHHSTRAGDPQVHTHVLLMNLCTRKDGTSGSIDSAKLGPMLKSIGAYYRSTLAQNLKAEGFTIQQKEDAFLIDCIPDQLIEKWSKRRTDIIAAADKAGFTTSEDREAAQLINLQTRKKKGDLPSRSAMEETWKGEMGDLGLSGKQIWKDTLSATGEPTETPPPEQVAATIVVEAVAELFETESVLEHRKILEKALILSQGKCPPDLIWPALAEAEESGSIVRLNPNDNDAEPVYSTPAIIQTENEIIEIAMQRKDERIFVAPHLIDKAIRKTNRGSFQLTDEQTAAVKHALGRDGLVTIDGKAGVGKSTVFASINDAAAAAGLDVHLVAPSWKAVGGTAKDLKNLKTSQARALAGFLNKVEAGKIKLNRKSVLLIDEAGMISTKDMHRLLVIADKSGAKVILAGDASQLSAVQAGDPLSLLIRRIGAAKIQKIIRQHSNWMAAASMNFASGKADKINEAIQAYSDRGHITLADDRETAMDLLAEAWLSSVQTGTETGVLAARNNDVTALNDRIRTKAIDAGLITGPAIEIDAVGRAKNAKAGPLAIQVGDRLLLGEGLRLAGKDVSNNSVMVVLAVDPGPPAKLVIRLEDGSITTISAADLTGPKARPVRMQHGLAGTIHSSQGATYSRTLVYDSANIKARSSYVAMTRHKDDVRVFVNTASIKDRYRQKPADRQLVTGPGGLQGFADEEEEIPTVEELTYEDRIKILATTWSAADRKLNASDFLTTPAINESEADEADLVADEADEDEEERLRRSKAARPVSGVAKPLSWDRPRP